MSNTSDFRNGLIIDHKNNLFKIVEFQHVKPGKGGAFVRTKLKNIKTGQMIDETIRSGANIDIIRIEAREYNYLYSPKYYSAIDKTSNPWGPIFCKPPWNKYHH